MNAKTSAFPCPDKTGKQHELTSTNKHQFPLASKPHFGPRVEAKFSFADGNGSDMLAA